MRKSYIRPTTQVITLMTRHEILASSSIQNDFEIGLSEEQMDGAQALSAKKENYWNTEKMW